MTKVIRGHLPPFDDLDDTPREIKVEKPAGGEDLVISTKIKKMK